jgi:predicted SAM-dependent methyltransferase
MKSELLIGCGNRKRKFLENQGPLENPVTLDLDPRCQPDVLHDLDVFPYPFADGAFDEIWASHILEHCGRQGDWRSFFVQWNEFYRIMKPGGLFFAVVPDRDSVWAWGDPGHTRIIQFETLIFLDQDSYQQCGITTMTDYRHVYHGDFRLIEELRNEHDYFFILERKL